MKLIITFIEPSGERHTIEGNSRELDAGRLANWFFKSVPDSRQWSEAIAALTPLIGIYPGPGKALLSTRRSGWQVIIGRPLEKELA